ncbi:MAG: hypothetical protein AAF805_00180 [Planctomycetota bacterium]
MPPTKQSASETDRDRWIRLHVARAKLAADCARVDAELAELEAPLRWTRLVESNGHAEAAPAESIEPGGWLHRRQAAARARVSVGTIDRWRKGCPDASGKPSRRALPAKTVGGRTLINADDLDRFLK